MCISSWLKKLKKYELIMNSVISKRFPNCHLIDLFLINVNNNKRVRGFLMRPLKSLPPFTNIPWWSFQGLEGTHPQVALISPCPGNLCHNKTKHMWYACPKKRARRPWPKKTMGSCTKCKAWGACKVCNHDSPWRALLKQKLIHSTTASQ